MRRRIAFSLVELLVAMALVIFIMVIVSETFVTALESVRLLKAQGEMQANLRVAASTLRSDLTDAHFDSSVPRPSHELSERANLTYQPSPSWGYFRIMQGSEPVAPNALYVNESPGDPHPAYVATDHVLAFTRLSSTTNQWYEVAYFLQPNGADAGGTPLYALYRRQNPVAGPNQANSQNGGVDDMSMPYNRYGMMNCDWSVYPPVAPQNSFGANGPSPGRNLGPYSGPNPAVGAPVALVNYVGGYSNWGMPSWEQCWQQAGNRYVTLDPSGYWQTQVAPNYNQQYSGAPISPEGDDILLTNVISFDVRVSIRTQPPDRQPIPYEFIDLFEATRRVVNDNNPPPTLNDQFWNGTNGRPAVFDTWCNWITKASPTPVQFLLAKTLIDQTMFNTPLPIQIVAVQITIRVWDERTQQARQITIVQNM